MSVRVDQQKEIMELTGSAGTIEAALEIILYDNVPNSLRSTSVLCSSRLIRYDMNMAQK